VWCQVIDQVQCQVMDRVMEPAPSYDGTKGKFDGGRFRAEENGFRNNNGGREAGWGGAAGEKEKG